MTQWGLDTLFNPAKRHMDEEKRRLQATRQQVGDTSGGKRIDLESGKVRIGKSGHAGDADAAAEGPDAAEAVAASEDGENAPAASPKSAPTSSAKPPLTPAQIRAAERRGRRPR